MARLPNYDNWLARPYEMAADAPECPECGGRLYEDKHERYVECEDCDYSYGFDWDAEAEARAEAREDRLNYG